MGTRSRIGVMHGDICKSVYCHWDGYLSHNGAILQQHYDSAKANHLVALGDISLLASQIGEQHPFSLHEVPEDMHGMTQDEFDAKFGNMTTFYMRDRNETDQEFQVSHNFDQFLELVDRSSAEYFYIMRDGVWYCGCLYAVEGMLPNTLYVLQEQLSKETA